MNFKLFVEILTEEVLEFREMWDINYWNDSYIDYKNHINHYYGKDYIATTTEKELVINWGKDFYQDATPETHNYWVRK